MATKLAEMPAKRRVHPWEEWTDGSVWLIKRHEDFPGKVESLRVRLYSKARELGKALDILVDKKAETITFRFYDAD
jgi:hypothetical protein